MLEETLDPTVQLSTQENSWEELVSQGNEAREQKDVAQRVLGECAHKVEKVYGHDALGKYAYEVGEKKNTLRRYRDVYRGYMGKPWHDRLSFTHHLIALGAENPEEMLLKAEDESWSSERLALEIQSQKTGEPVVNKPAPPEYCPECKAWKVDTICSCRIFK